MIKTGAQIVIETLIEQGVKTIFGYPGGAVLDIYDELYNNSDRIKHIITAHEQGASHAADAYARVSGKVGVVLSTSGPGATNLVTGIANAYLDSTPLVAITGNVATPLMGRDSFQEVDITGITEPITKHNYVVKDIANLADTIRNAFRIAKSGRPGPVLVDIPKDIQSQKCEYTPASISKKDAFNFAKTEDIALAAEYINKAKKPYIYCGGGVVLSDSQNELLSFADKIDAPIACSMMGLSAVPNNNPRFLGMTGMHGMYAASKAKAECDLLIAVGVRFSDRATGKKDEYAKNATIIHIDVDPAEIHKNIIAGIGLIGNMKDTLGSLLALVDEIKHDNWMSEIETLKLNEICYFDSVDTLNPKKIIDTVEKYTDDRTIVATDVGQHQMWTAQYYKFKTARTFITSGGLGTMGFGMGAAIGACVANYLRTTVLFTGDGSFGMNLNELSTAVSNNFPLVIIIMNNGVLGMVRQWQTTFYDKHYSSTTLKRQTDFVKLAEAFGARGFRVDTLCELEKTIEKAFALKSPVVVDCHIDKDERVLPMIPPNGTIDHIILD